MRTLDMKVVELLVDKLQWSLLGCRSCPAFEDCQAKYDLDMRGPRGTECAAIIRTWAYDAAREKMTNAMRQEDMCHCIVDGHHGVYIPQYFAETFNWEQLHLTEDHSDARDTLLAGPDVAEFAQEYWEAWGEVLDAAWFEDENGLTWRIHQGESGDVFEVVDGYFDRFPE